MADHAVQARVPHPEPLLIVDLDAAEPRLDPWTPTAAPPLPTCPRPATGIAGLRPGDPAPIPDDTRSLIGAVLALLFVLAWFGAVLGVIGGWFL